MARTTPERTRAVEDLGALIRTVVVPGKAALLAVGSRWTPAPRPAA